MSGYPRFPLFIDLTGQKVVLVGGGQVALRRVRTLQQCGADVVVIAPTLHPDMPTVTHISRPYRPGDLAGATLAVAATDSRETNGQVAQEAKARQLELEEAKAAAFAQGVNRGIDPFMTLSFMALPVIPTLRLTTRGVIDVVTQRYV